METRCEVEIIVVTSWEMTTFYEYALSKPIPQQPASLVLRFQFGSEDISEHIQWTHTIDNVFFFIMYYITEWIISTCNRTENMIMPIKEHQNIMHIAGRYSKGSWDAMVYRWGKQVLKMV